SRLGRPWSARHSLTNCGSIGQQLIKTHFTRVALSERVRRDQPGLTAGMEDVVSAEHEVRHEIRTAALSAADRVDQVLAVGRAEGPGELLTAKEGRIADDGVETRPGRR